MNPTVFGPEHCIYMAVSLLSAVILCICVKKYIKSENAQALFFRCAGGILFLVIFSNRMALVFEYGEANWLKLLPDSFCSASSFVLALALLLGKKDNPVLHFVWLISLAGGTITTFYSDFIGQNPSFLYPPTILGMLHHTLSAVTVLLLLLTGYLRISGKMWYTSLVGMVAYFSYGAFLYFVLDFGNPFYMVSPALPGTIFTAWGLLPIYFIVYSAILWITEQLRHRQKTAGALQSGNFPQT